MERRKNPRVLMWMMIVAIIFAVFYYYFDQQPVSEDVPPAVSQAAITSDFMAMKDIEVPVQAPVGGKFFTTELLFSKDFTGEVGEIFYARMEDGHVAITMSYRVAKLSDDTPTFATYEPLKEYAPDYDPGPNFVSSNMSQQELDTGKQ